MKMELANLIRQVSHEREIEPERLVAALEEAISQAARKHYRERGVRTKIDLENGELICLRVRKVVATPEEILDPTAEMLLDEARTHDPAVELEGEIVLGELDASNLGRIAAQAARQMLFQRVREAERDNIYGEYIGKLGELINGIVKRFEHGGIVIELGRTEGIVPRHHQVRHERYSQGDRIRAVIVDVTKDANKPQVVLSRTAPQLLIKLLEMEVPEIYDGTVIIKGCVREPGERAKVAVASRDRDVDPVGACVGMKGSRVQAIMRELKGEKVDIIPYSPDIVTFAQSALAPAKINRVALREQTMRVPITDAEGNTAFDDSGDAAGASSEARRSSTSSCRTSSSRWPSASADRTSASPPDCSTHASRSRARRRSRTRWPRPSPPCCARSRASKRRSRWSRSRPSSPRRWTTTPTFPSKTFRGSATRCASACSSTATRTPASWPAPILPR